MYQVPFDAVFLHGKSKPRNMNISRIINMFPAANVGVIVLGAGHSGTSTVACELAGVGFRYQGNSHQCEDSRVVRINQDYLQSRNLHHRVMSNFSEIDSFLTQPRSLKLQKLQKLQARAKRLLLSLPNRFVLKDPRFVWTLHLWTPLFPRLPVLVRVRRDDKSVWRSHVLRHENVTINGVNSRQLWDKWQLSQWPGSSVSFHVHDLSKRVRVMNKHQNKHQHKHQHKHNKQMSRATLGVTL